MSYNLIISEINKIQKDYKNLLIKLMPILDTEKTLLALDEINLFWESNIEIIELYLKKYIKTQNAFIFTASTFLDIENQDHLPFLLLGNIHIFDDPLSKYALSLVRGVPVTKYMLEQVKLTVEDNIKIINECEKNILVLPVRVLNQLTENTVLRLAAEQCFCSMFNGIDTINDYMKQCNTFQDINNYLKETAKKHIVFSDKDNYSLPFEQRYFEAKKTQSNKLVNNNTDGEIFFSLVYGPIQQAIDILISCIEYECIPFVRYKVALHYIIMLSQNFKTIEGFGKIDIVKYKACIVYLIYNIFESDKNKVDSVDKFIGIIKADNFESNLLKSLEAANQNKDNYSIETMANIIEERLKSLYEKLK